MLDYPTQDIYADSEEVSIRRIKFHDGNGNNISPVIIKKGESNVLAQVKSTDNVKACTADGKNIYVIEMINIYSAEINTLDKDRYVFSDNCNYYACVHSNGGFRRGGREDS